MSDPGCYGRVGGTVEGVAVGDVATTGEDEEGGGGLPGIGDEGVGIGDGGDAVIGGEDGGQSGDCVGHCRGSCTRTWKTLLEDN